MSLKFNQKKKFSLAKEYPKYPEIVMQWTYDNNDYENEISFGSFCYS